MKKTSSSPEPGRTAVRKRLLWVFMILTILFLITYFIADRYYYHPATGVGTTSPPERPLYEEQAQKQPAADGNREEPAAENAQPVIPKLDLKILNSPKKDLGMGTQMYHRNDGRGVAALLILATIAKMYRG